MANKLSDLIKRTDPTAADLDTTDLDSGRIVTHGVGLREGEITAIKAIAEQLGGKEEGVTVNGIMRLAIRLFLLNVRAGKVNPAEYYEEPEKPKKRARLPR